MRTFTFIAATALFVGAAAPAMAQDAAAGETAFNKCRACHAVGEGAKNKIGPQLNGIFEHKPGGLEDYRYSAPYAEWSADKAEWTDELMAQWLEDPRGTVKGTKMAFAGLKNPEERANVIAYLKTFNLDGTAK